MRKKNKMMKISFNPPFNPVSVFVSFHSHSYNHKTAVLYATYMQEFIADAAVDGDDDDDFNDDNAMPPPSPSVVRDNKIH